VDDGHVTVQETIGIHEVPPTSIPGPVGTVSSGTSPLTSGHDAAGNVVLGNTFSTVINNDPAAGQIQLAANFQKWNLAGATATDANGISYKKIDPTNTTDVNGDNVEAQVSIYLLITDASNVTHTFQAIVANDGDTNQWIYNSSTGLVEATVQFTAAQGTGADVGTTLATYLLSHPTTGTDSWTVQYDDTTPGPEQARYFHFGFDSFDPGNPGIVVNGSDTLPDQIYGGIGNDLLTGNGGDDIILGRDGNDILTGGAGNDILVGGAGHDTMTGGAGNDTFVFNVISDSSNNLSLSDVITDFVHGTDKIDLSAIDADTGIGGNQAFAFGGQNASTVAHNITWSESGGNTIIHIDNSGDTTADSQIILTGINLGLTSTDFNL
jgi:Ca2+-binding RTX toxin-like protein